MVSYSTTDVPQNQSPKIRNNFAYPASEPFSPGYVPEPGYRPGLVYPAAGAFSDPSPEAQNPLVRHTEKIGGADSEGLVVAKNRRFQLQRVAAELLAGSTCDRVCRCMKDLVTDKSGAKHTMVDIYRCDAAQDAFFRNVFCCNYAWSCPVCGAKLSEQKREEIEAGIKVWHKSKRSTLHATMTCRYYRGEACRGAKKRIQSAFTQFWNSKSVRGLRRAYKIAGYLYALEPLVNIAADGVGWHIHYHVVLFFDDLLVENDDISVLEAIMAHHWADVVGSIEGGYASKKHGLRLSSGHQDLSEYLTKYDRLPVAIPESFSKEVTKNHLKASKKGLSPVDLLVAYEATQEPEIGDLFLEFSETFKGTHQIRWSNGLKQKIGALSIGLALVGIDISKKSEPEPGPELLKQEYNLICQISGKCWEEVYNLGLIGKVLMVAAYQGDYALREFLEEHGIKDCYYPRIEEWERLGLRPGEYFSIDLAKLWEEC